MAAISSQVRLSVTRRRKGGRIWGTRIRRCQAVPQCCCAARRVTPRRAAMPPRVTGRPEPGHGFGDGVVQFGGDAGQSLMVSMSPAATRRL